MHEQPRWQAKLVPACNADLKRPGPSWRSRQDGQAYSYCEHLRLDTAYGRMKRRSRLLSDGVAHAGRARPTRPVPRLVLRMHCKLARRRSAELNLRLTTGGSAVVRCIGLALDVWRVKLASASERIGADCLRAAVTRRHGRRRLALRLRCSRKACQALAMAFSTARSSIA